MSAVALAKAGGFFNIPYYGNLGLCHDKRTRLDIVNEIGRRFDALRATLYVDVEATANQLRAECATDLESVNA